LASSRQGNTAFIGWIFGLTLANYFGAFTRILFSAESAGPSALVSFTKAEDP
jgi:hypothetical protein